MIAHDPLHGSGRADFPHPARALGNNAHAAQGIGMTDRGPRQPAFDQAPHTIPEDVAVFSFACNLLRIELRRRMHTPIPEQGKWLQAVVRGHIRYYGVPMNTPALWIFRFQVGWLWRRALSRRRPSDSRIATQWA
jgi:hypothetical protein